jgi:hypothetical protein
MRCLCWGRKPAEVNGVGSTTMTQVREPSSLLVDTLRMSERELLRMLGQLAGGTGDAARNIEHTCTVVMNYPRAVMRLRDRTMGAWNTYVVKPRAVHEHAMTFLHGSYVHRGVRSDVLLRDAHGRPVQLGGTVVMCRHVCGRVHEVVTTFDNPIDLRSFRFSDGSALSQPALWHDAQPQLP